jgi:hypothetical protein
MGSTDEVLIVGAGPTGLLLAGDLAAARVPCTVLERRADESNLTRAFAVHSRTLELLDARGIADDLVAAGTAVGTLRLFGRFQLDLSRLPSRFPFVLLTPQYHTERLLTERAAALGAELAHGAGRAARQLPRRAAPGRPERAAHQRHPAAAVAGAARGPHRHRRGRGADRAAGQPHDPDGVRHRGRLPGAARRPPARRRPRPGRAAGGRRPGARPAVPGAARRALRAGGAPRRPCRRRPLGRARGPRRPGGGDRHRDAGAPGRYVAWAGDETDPERRAEALRQALTAWCGAPVRSLGPAAG